MEYVTLIAEHNKIAYIGPLITSYMSLSVTSGLIVR